MRLLLIANHRSRRGAEPDRLAAELERAGAELVGRQPIEGLDAGAADGAERVVVAGGDGSVAPAAVLARALDVPLAVLAVGTANDFARALDLPRDLQGAVALAVAPSPRLADCELGWIDGERPFVNVASAGLASIAARRARPHKARFGPLAYGYGALRAGLSAAPLELRVELDGVRLHSGPCWQVVVAVTGAFGAGSGIADTDAADGQLDVVLIPSGSRLGLFRRAWGLRTHSIAEQRGVVRARGRAVRLATLDGSPLELNVDGEIATLASGSAALTVVAPAFRCVVRDRTG